MQGNAQVPQWQRWMYEADSAACHEARNAIVAAFPNISKAAFRVVCYGLDPDRRHGAAKAREMAESFGELPSTLMSHWFRTTKGTLSPKRVLSRFMLLRATALFDHKRASGQGVALYLGYSSSQSFHRTLRTFRNVRTIDGLRSKGFSCELAELVEWLGQWADALSKIPDGLINAAPVWNGATHSKCPTCRGSGMVEHAGLVRRIAERAS